MKRLKVLIACEHTGAVRDAFTALGHDATSCDLLPTETPGKHYQGNVLDILNDGWDLMIGHPPCTFLSFAANRVFHSPGRSIKRAKALEFVALLWEAPIKHICLENPLGLASAIIGKPSQIIHPYYFGDTEKKRTCLWLKNLPKLHYSLENNLFEQATAAKEPEPSFTWTNKHGKVKHEYFTYGDKDWKRRSMT